MVTSRAGPAAPVLCPLCLSHISAHASKQHDLPTNIATNTFWIESFYYWITLNFLITSLLVRSRGSYLTINVYCFLVKIYSILNFCAVWPTFRIVQLTWHAMGLKFAYQLFIASMEHSATNMVWLTLHRRPPALGSPTFNFTFHENPWSSLKKRNFSVTF